ncbi:hypothetical protein LTX13_001223 [Clostridium perfringens]|uniref:hypothetical protein n=1 Tax=Clostridium perfringens TaxID=1502 RepID=UPI0013E389AA|nr:hypothetical protein [Clostridium perfringens]MDK0738295.1 hypothetical protein [Clostridium perfringens]MDM0535491.1 hypothetical protein [Clostridium perfringens]NGT83411.1 hypothetical protein [Clostridium perfringens]HBI7033248.1 hypothetical protein [Clostridium perfringens]HBI7043215.1 hypothetical protein [Clostridium perfringens]
MWSKKVHKICDLISFILVVSLSLITIIYLLDLGLVGKALTLVIASIFIRIYYFYLMQRLKVWLKPKEVKEQHITKVKVSEPTLDLQQQCLIDLKSQASQLFKVAMQNQKLNRAEIISIKDYLKNNINDPTLINKKYINEAHFIYSYLKSQYINEETLNCVIKNIFIFANRKSA